MNCSVHGNGKRHHMLTFSLLLTMPPNQFVADITSKFEKLFPTEHECVVLLLRIRSFKQKTLCSKCANTDHEIMYRWKKNNIKCKRCRKETAFSYGTIFYKSKLSLRVWLRLIWLWSNLPLSSPSINSVQLSLILDIKQSSVYDCLKRLRQRSIPAVSNKLPGHVEVDLLLTDKSSVSNYKYPGENSWYILIAVQAGKSNSGDVRMIALRNITNEAYHDFVDEFIKFRDANFEIERVSRGDRLNKQLNPSFMVDDFKSEGTNIYSSLPIVNDVADILNDFLRNFHGGILHPSSPKKKSHIQDYLNEFCWRWNNRHRNGKDEKYAIFEEVVECSVQDKRENPF